MSVGMRVARQAVMSNRRTALPYALPPRPHSLRAVSAVTAAAVLMLAPATLRAQCGAERTSCGACHDGAHASRPSDVRPHRDHAFAELCVACHGGKGDEPERTVAHRGLVAPLGEAGARCAECHSPVESWVARYADGAGAGSPSGGTGAAARGVVPPSPHGSTFPNAALAIVAVGLALLFSYLVQRGEAEKERAST